jgi:molybdopterin biosynthesis enzyme
MARLVEQDGVTAAEAVRCAGSSDLVAAAHADGAIVAPVGARELRAGDIIAFRPWGGVA